mmetsp:Transcript_80202/g.183801  ORF Transcript_80202/g.183801 Transcript_80202/m.183801 type:complete len:84 (+) Transcript_80202:701-952(+)
MEALEPTLVLAAAALIPRRANVAASLCTRKHQLLQTAFPRLRLALLRHQTDVAIVVSTKQRHSDHGLISKRRDAVLCGQQHPL